MGGSGDRWPESFRPISEALGCPSFLHSEEGAAGKQPREEEGNSLQVSEFPASVNIRVVKGSL